MTQPSLSSPSKRRSSRRGIDKWFDSLDDFEPWGLNYTQEAYLTNNWQPEITAAKRRYRRSKFWFQSLRFLSVAGALALPALVSLNLGDAKNSIQWATFAVSIIVTLSTAGLQVFRFGTEWGIDQEYANALATEGWAYFQRAGKYLGMKTPDAYQEFFRAVEDLQRLRNEKLVNEIVAAATSATTGSEARLGTSPKSTKRPSPDKSAKE